MAKVKITGHASGTGVVTVTAPNTSTDRTVTLPDTTGTLLDENSNVPAANLTGTVATARLGSGTASSGTILYGDQTYKTAPTSFNPDGAVVFNQSGADVDFRVEADNDEYALFIEGANGNVGISDSAPQAELSINVVSTNAAAHTTGIQVRQNAYAGYKSGMSAGDTVATTYNCGFIGFSGGTHTGYGTRHIVFETRAGTTDTAPTERMRISDGGAVSVVGALSKGSGSFKIDHPLPAKKDTHHLVHSFVESPRADLIYRDKVTLVNGSSTVNIDTVAGMTEGTFVLLCDDVQCFTSNESDWDAVKGSVTGNILTIESQNPACTAEIAWMVIADRKDEHIMGTEWTDENGKPIIEPEKVIEKDELDRDDFETDEEYQTFLTSTGQNTP